MHGTGLEHLKRSEFRKTVLEKGALWRAEYGAVKRDVRYNRLTFTGEMQHCADLRRQPWCLPSRIGLFFTLQKDPTDAGCRENQRNKAIFISTLSSSERAPPTP
jgi:hypothetical protein